MFRLTISAEPGETMATTTQDVEKKAHLILTPQAITKVR
jgi:hypothetical protein